MDIFFRIFLGLKSGNFLYQIPYKYILVLPNISFEKHMDDFIPQTLNESLNEWCARLVNILTPRVIENLWILLEEARKTSADAKQLDKYLLSFQQLLQFVPKWSSTQVEEIRKQIIRKSGCNHLEELVTCAHIIMTKALVCARPGNRQKQLNVNIPKIDNFLHKVFIKSAGHSYRNAYLFEKEVVKLQYQKNMHDLEILVQRSILDTVRENIPEEEIIRAFLDENYEYEEEVIIEPIPDEDSGVSVSDTGATSDKVDTKESSESGYEKYSSSSTGNQDDENEEKHPYIQDINSDPVITRLEFNEEDTSFKPYSTNSNTNVATLANSSSSSDPKTIQQLADRSAAMGFMKDQEQASDKMSLVSSATDVNLDDIMDILDDKPSISDTFSGGQDFMLDIEDLA